MKILLLLIPLLMGCGGQARFIRDDIGRVTQIKTKGNIEASAKTKDEEVHASSKMDWRILDLNMSKFK